MAHQQNLEFVGGQRRVTAPRSRQRPAATRARRHVKVPRGAVMNATEVADRWFNTGLIKGANDECSTINEGWEAGAEAAGTRTDG